MSFRNYLEQYLLSRGVWPDWAKEIISATIEELRRNELAEVLDIPVETYPQVLLATILIYLEFCTLEFIDKNCPTAWFRSAFEKKDR